MNNTNLLLVLGFVLAAGMLAGVLLFKEPLPPPATMTGVDLNKYEGIWFSVNEIPQKYTEGCTCTRAIYQLTSTNSIIVTNKCDRNGNESIVIGEATPIDDTGGRYSVQFQDQLLPFKGSYNILSVAADYRFAVVGDDERESLWFLSRERTLSQEDYSYMVQVAVSQGYDVSQLVPVEQSTCG